MTYPATVPHSKNTMYPHAVKLIHGFSIADNEDAQAVAIRFNIETVVFPSGKKVLSLDLYYIPVDYNIGSFLDLLEKEGVIYRNIKDIR